MIAVSCIFCNGVTTAAILSLLRSQTIIRLPLLSAKPFVAASTRDSIKYPGQPHSKVYILQIILFFTPEIIPFSILLSKYGKLADVLIANLPVFFIFLCFSYIKHAHEQSSVS
jgi:hypothetical protein